MSHVARYHPLLVALHWVLALIVIAALFLGAVKLAPMPINDPRLIDGLRAHMTGGLVILGLMTLRLLTRRLTTHPAKANTGSALLDLLARISHAALYITVFGMCAVGILLAWQAGLFGVVFGGHGVLPPDLWVYWLRWVHFAISRILMFLIALHICGALYHIFILRDGLLRRMFFGKRKQPDAVV